MAAEGKRPVGDQLVEAEKAAAEGGKPGFHLCNLFIRYVKSVCVVDDSHELEQLTNATYF